jgi:cytochrome c peroxidase
VSFVRFVLLHRDQESGVATGLFETAYHLRDQTGVSAADRDLLRDALAWFERHLATPARFNRTSSKGHYRRKTKGIAWFRDTATDCVARMHTIKQVLEAHGHQVTMIREDRVGYVVYEDELQVVAEPFADTNTGAT